MVFKIFKIDPHYPKISSLPVFKLVTFRAIIIMNLCKVVWTLRQLLCHNFKQHNSTLFRFKNAWTGERYKIKMSKGLQRLVCCRKNVLCLNRGRSMGVWYAPLEAGSNSGHTVLPVYFNMKRSKYLSIICYGITWNKLYLTLVLSHFNCDLNCA